MRAVAADGDVYAVGFFLEQGYVAVMLVNLGVILVQVDNRAGHFAQNFVLLKEQLKKRRSFGQ